MNARVDAGEIIACQKINIEPTDTTVTLRDKLFLLGGELFVKYLPIYLSGQAKLIEQNPDKVVKTQKLTKEMGLIDWGQSVDCIDRQIRALNPWPGTYTFIGEKRLKILEAVLSDGKLELRTVQLEGKNPTNWKDFVRGYANQLTKTDWFSTIQQ